MKKILILLLFISILPLVSGAIIQDHLDDSGNLKEIITVNSNIKNIYLPKGAQHITVNATSYQINGTELKLNSCTNGCIISFTLKNVIVKNGVGKSFSRNLKAFEPSQYRVYVPIGSIINLTEETVVPQADTITSDGMNTILMWNVNYTKTQRYYIYFTNHEKTEQYGRELTGELSESSVILIILFFALLAFIAGYLLRKDKKISVVAEQLLSPDEKTLLQEINRHYKHNNKKITQKELGKKLNWSKSKVSGVMTLLVQKKLVEKEKVGRNYTVRSLTRIEGKK